MKKKIFDAQKNQYIKQRRKINYMCKREKKTRMMSVKRKKLSKKNHIHLQSHAFQAILNLYIRTYARTHTHTHMAEHIWPRLCMRVIYF